MGRILKTNVYVGDTWHLAGSTPPDDVAEQIANPKVWAEESGVASVEQVQADLAAPEVKQPPRRGPGSGGPAWIEFAASKGVTEKFDSKEALQRHLEDAGLIEKE